MACFRMTVLRKSKGASAVPTCCTSSGPQRVGSVARSSGSPRTRKTDFSPKWITKLKTDQQNTGADIAAIVSVASRNGSADAVEFCEDVWIAQFSAFAPLAVMLRNTLLHVDRERVVSRHRDTLKDIVYDYFTCHDFARRVKNIISSYVQMQKDLESEKRSMTRIWNKREAQIRLVIDSTSAMFGEIEGMVSGEKAIPVMDVLKLEESEDIEEEPLN